MLYLDSIYSIYVASYIVDSTIYLQRYFVLLTNLLLFQAVVDKTQPHVFTPSLAGIV